MSAESINQLVVLMAEQTPALLFDNVGISIDIHSLECYPQFEKASIACFGRGRLERFWKRRIYPVLRPRRHTELLQAWQEGLEEIRLELLSTSIIEHRSRRR